MREGNQAQFRLEKPVFRQKAVLDGMARGYALEWLCDMNRVQKRARDDAAWVKALSE